MTVKVPGLREPVGLGDAVKAATTAAGVKPCGGCAKRAEILNRVRLVPARESNGTDRTD